jgi:hypothetical protein
LGLGNEQKAFPKSLPEEGTCQQGWKYLIYYAILNSKSPSLRVTKDSFEEGFRMG